MNVGLIGCGLMGQRRAQALGHHRLVAVADADHSRAEAMAKNHPGAVAAADWRRIVERQDVDCIIVATTNDWLAPISLAAIEAGRHVLVEKPVARTLEELKPLLTVARKAKVVVMSGFSHRYYPGLQKAKEICDSGELGRLMFIRGRYGHGGRIGYDREWRARPEISGGGELIDQGLHLIDLARWFMGEFSDVDGSIHTYFWNMPVEDNVFMCLKTPQGQIAWLHASCTEWKNMFSFEIFGRQGKLSIEGLSGSYGVQRLIHYKMTPEMGPPQVRTWEFPGEDASWKNQFKAFTQAVQKKGPPETTLDDAQAALEIARRIYQASK